MNRLFGTDGVRGIANETLTGEMAYKIGLASAHLLTLQENKPKILIGRDTRLSGDMLESAIAAGVCAAGAEAVLLGVVPTPAVAYMTRKLGADAGIMISASHNPAEYNGIKIFNGEGYKLADELEDEIEKIVRGKVSPTLPSGKEVGAKQFDDTAKKDYAAYLASTCEGGLDGMKIVLDAANGAASEIAQGVFETLGAEVTVYYDTPDGININEGCGSTHPEFLQQKVVELGADLGLAFDGDADRLIAVDHLGNVVDGDKVIAICAMELKRSGKLAKDTVVVTVMSNLGLMLYMEEQGIHVVKSGVGDRYVLEEMRRDGYVFGGEQSGHIIFLEYNTTGDGVLSGIQLASILKKENKTLASLAEQVPILPQVLINAKVSETKKYNYEGIPAIIEAIEHLEKKMANRGRVLIRPSGTEPLVRVMIEGEDMQLIQREAENIAALIEQHLA